MKEGKASWTAEGVAFYRALESMLPEDERACYDPLAKEFLGTWFSSILRNPIRTKIARLYIERGGLAPSYFSLIARTAYIDNCLRECIEDGIEQLVILGAGFDSRAYRFDGLKDKVRVFEVDHPSTQAVKVMRVKNALGSPGDHVTYVPINFEREKLEPRLLESGYDRDMKTHFIWEGVTSYLTAEAVDETLTFVAGNSVENSSIVFTYAYKSPTDGVMFRGEKWWRMAYLERRGEPHIFGIEEGTIDGFLSARGFRLIENICGKDAITSNYIKALARGRIANHGAIARAVVMPQ